ncbi:S-layer homology domain-containing protein [Cohnella sp. NL03-T5]|nr:S-layer homology domain-containing protein [Cohnella silvisoli]
MVAFILLFTVFNHNPRASAAGTQLPFDDISDNFATEAIVHLTKLNLINGTGNRKFEPYKAISRAEFIALVDRLLAITPVSSAISPFSDVPKTAWYYEWVQPAVQLGIVQGTSPSRFEPDRSVTREEASVLMTRALKQKVGIPIDVDTLYLDQDLIEAWALPSVYHLHQLGLMEGASGNFRPQAPISRQEAAVLLNRVLTRSGWSEQIHATPAPKIQLGWQYGQTTKQFEQQITQSHVNTLSPRWFFLGKAGTVENQIDPSLLPWAHKLGKKVWAMVGNHSDQLLTHQMLSSTDQRKTFIQNLSDIVRNNGIDGLNIDFENVRPEDRNYFTLFVAELAKQLHAIRAVLSVNVSPDFGSDWTEVFDYAELEKYADYIVLMAYDEHWGGDAEAGSVSSLPWLQKGLETLMTQVPASKVILALPLYTRDWYSNATSMTSSAEWSLLQQNSLVQSHVIKPVWNDYLGQYYASYRSQNMQHQLWLEDGRSLTLKALLGEKNSIAGYGYWYMGGESIDIWASLRNVMKFSSYHFS